MLASVKSINYLLILMPQTMKLDLIRHEVNWPLDLFCLAADENQWFSFSFLCSKHVYNYLPLTVKFDLYYIY